MIWTQRKKEDPLASSYPDPSTSFYPSKVVPIYKVGMSLESLIIIVLI